MPKIDDYDPSVNYGKFFEDFNRFNPPDSRDRKYKRSLGERFVSETTTPEKIGIAGGAALFFAAFKLARFLKRKPSSLQIEILSNLESQRNWDYCLSERRTPALRKARLGLILDEYVSPGCIGLTDKGMDVLRARNRM